MPRTEWFSSSVAFLPASSKSAAAAGHESVQRLLRPREVEHLGLVVLASLIGFLGNEVVALLRIKVGKEIGSAPLNADGYHARVDGW